MGSVAAELAKVGIPLLRARSLAAVAHGGEAISLGFSLCFVVALADFCVPPSSLFVARHRSLPLRETLDSV